MAADSPLTTPWAYQDRGSMRGSSDHHQNSSATAAPASVGGRSSQPRPRAALAVGGVEGSLRLLPHAHPQPHACPGAGYRRACRGSRQPKAAATIK